MLRLHIILLQARNSIKKSLYHPDDIKTVGLAQPRSQSGPVLYPKPSSPTRTPSGSLAARPRSARPGVSPITPTIGAHTRSLSLGSGSLGRVEAQRIYAQAELERYVEDEDEDYEDVFIAPTDQGLKTPVSIL